MRKSTVVVIALVTAGSMSGAVATAAAAPRHDYPYVEIWCDTDATNGDGTGFSSITPNQLTAAEGAEDDVVAKVVDGSSLDPGNHEISAGKYNAHAGVIQGWFCGRQVWVDGPA
jgi:hypothetical protein